MQKLFEYVEHIGKWRVLIQTRDIKNGAVTTEKLSDNSITNEKLADGSITGDKLRDDSVSGEKLADGSVSSEKLADGAISGEKLADNAISGEKLADGSVSGAKLEDGAVGAEKMAADAVSESKLQDGAVTNEKIADEAVTNEKIADGAVHDRHIAPGAISDLRNLLSGYVSASEAQSFTAKQQARGRENIHAGTPSPLVVAQSDGVSNIAPYVLNRWAEPQESLSVTFQPGISGMSAEYMLEFTVRGDAFVLTLPLGVRWADEPDWTDGATYQVSILDGFAVYAEWEGIDN